MDGAVFFIPVMVPVEIKDDFLCHLINWYYKRFNDKHDAVGSSCWAHTFCASFVISIRV